MLLRYCTHHVFQLLSMHSACVENLCMYTALNLAPIVVIGNKIGMVCDAYLRIFFTYHYCSNNPSTILLPTSVMFLKGVVGVYM